jgi:ribosomal protein S18 acetylase RimI-like enzyme
VIVRDWLVESSTTLAPMFERERQHWLTALRWDPARAHAQIELARTTWGLPGLVAVDTDAVRGVAYFLEAAGRLELGGLISDGPDVTRALLCGVLDHAAARGISRLFSFSSAHAPGLEQELERCGFDRDPFIYVERSLAVAGTSMNETPGVPVPVMRPWRIDDLDATAALLHRAFDPEEAAIFAPGHTIESWSLYIRNLVEHGACGALDAEASLCVPRGNGIGAVTLVTTISDDTVHLVQVAVDPACRGQRLATRLLRQSCDIARVQGKTAMTLMVAGRNARARSLYAELGFTPRATFLAATKTMGLAALSTANGRLTASAAKD